MKKIELHIKDKIPEKEEFSKDKIKIVVVHKNKRRYENDLAIIRFGDLLELTDGLLQSVEVISD